MMLNPDDRKAETPYSSLYSRYNGFLLGQFSLQSFFELDKHLYAQRRTRMQEFLDEVGATLELPKTPFALGSGLHLGLIEEMSQSLQGVDTEIEDFFWLALHLMRWGASEGNSRSDGGMVLEYVRKYKLPDPQLNRFVTANMQAMFSVSLNYLTEILGTIDREPQTAFVIMPFSEPFASYYEILYEPTLERAGFRAFRAWGGLGDEDYIGLLTTIIDKVGLVWADVFREQSGPRTGERNPNVLYEVGAARALGVRVILIVNGRDRAGLPANIGHEAVLVYSPTADGWPEAEVVRLASDMASESPLISESTEDRTLRRMVDRILYEPPPNVALPESGAAENEPPSALDRNGREVRVGDAVRDIHGDEYVVKKIFDTYRDTKTPSPHGRRLFLVDEKGGRRYSPAKDFGLVDDD